MTYSIAQYEKNEALGRVLHLAAYDEQYAATSVLDLYQRIVGPISEKQYFFWRDAKADAAFICWGHLDRFSFARYTGGLWPVNHVCKESEKNRYIFAAISPYIDSDELVEMLMKAPQSEGFKYFINIPGAPQTRAIRQLGVKEA